MCAMLLRQTRHTLTLTVFPAEKFLRTLFWVRKIKIKKKLKKKLTNSLNCMLCWPNLQLASGTWRVFVFKCERTTTNCMNLKFVVHIVSFWPEHSNDDGSSRWHSPSKASFAIMDEGITRPKKNASEIEVNLRWRVSAWSGPISDNWEEEGRREEITWFAFALMRSINFGRLLKRRETIAKMLQILLSISRIISIAWADNSPRTFPFGDSTVIYRHRYYYILLMDYLFDWHILLYILICELYEP